MGKISTRADINETGRNPLINNVEVTQLSRAKPQLLKYNITVFVLCSLSRASMFTRDTDWVCETVNIQYKQADK